MSNPDSNNLEGSAEEPSFEEKVQLEIEKAKQMKIGDLKLKLQAKGVLTSTFCEKHEFVRAYAEAVVRGKSTPAAEVEDCESGEDDGGDDDEDAVEGIELPGYMVHRVNKLKELHEDRETMMQNYLTERAVLEAKYHKLTKPLYEKRAEIVNGRFDEEIAKDHEDKNDETNNEEKKAGIPQFWVCALGNMGPIAEMMTEKDIDCLEHLTDIQCHDDEDGKGFTLEFYFAPNPFFENEVLTKRYEVPNLLQSDEPILKDVQGCDIRWKPGKCLTFVETTKQQKGKGKNAGQIRTVTKKERSESFFHFFTPPQLPSFDGIQEEEVNRVENEFDEDYDIAQAFRSHVIPKAVMWFVGQAMDQEMDKAMEGMQWPEGGAADGDEQPECKQS